jgi:purine-cytosine permease-like protein
MTQKLSRKPEVEEADVDTMTASKETMEDYTLRFAPRSYRKWSTGVVGISALGGIAYLADFAIGANVGISYGTTNALWGILIFAIVILATGFPVAYYSARYNIDLDLVTRGSGFGYYGSVVTNVIFATFTFIFFALEGSIMAQGLELGLGIPLWMGYAVSTLIIFPLVIYGMKVLSTLQVWTTPLWLILMVAPFGYLVVSHPESVASSLPTRARTVSQVSIWVLRCWRQASACRSLRRLPNRTTICASCRR